MAVDDSSFFAWHHSSFTSLVCYSCFCQPYFYTRPPTTIITALPVPPAILFPPHWPTFTAPVEIEGKIFILVNGKTRLEREVLPVNRCCERNFLLRPSSSTSSSKGTLGKTGLRGLLKFILQIDYIVRLDSYLIKICLLNYAPITH